MIVCSLFSVTGCTCQPSKKATQAALHKFTTPPVPTLLTSREQRAEFVVTHYWDNYDFSDTTLISRADYIEQAFADFINILPNVSMSLAERGIEMMMSKAKAESKMYAHFMELSEKYLYDPNSPYRNEEYYIVVLCDIVANDKLPEIEKVRPQYQLELALKNRVGAVATNFEYTTDSRTKAKLHSSKADVLMLFFFRPDCKTCEMVKEHVVKNGIDKHVKIVWVNLDTDTHLDTLYDLRASPTLYLLDKNKTVLLKDAFIEQIENYLKTLQQ